MKFIAQSLFFLISMFCLFSCGNSNVEVAKFGEPIAEGEKICLGVLKEEEKEQYLAVKYEYSSMKGAYKNVEFREGTWKDFIEDNTFVCSIYEKKSNEYVGYCSIVNLAKKELELAIELKPDQCHKGYGSEALRLFMEEVCKVTGRQYFRVRVEIDNHASQGLMKKLGAYPNGVSEFLLHGSRRYSWICIGVSD